MKHMQSNSQHETYAALSATNRSPYLVWLIWVIWLPFLIPPLVNLLQSHPTPLHLFTPLIEVTLFLALYLWATLQTASRLVKVIAPMGYTQISIWLLGAVLATLSFAIASTGQTNQWLGPFIFTSGYVGGSLRTMRAIGAVLALALLLVIWGGLLKLGWLDLLQGEVFIIAVGFIIMFVVRAIQTNWELRAAREEIARLAVTTERLRIARDLHDLLGHNLSLITLKSELAGKLVSVAPARAASEIADVEQVARMTLQEVREAVASYRQPTLLNELHGVQEILAAAGIKYRYQGHAIESLPQEVEAVLAWTVREGVTNVIRHSKAKQCTISLRQEKQDICVEIFNDGVESSSLLQDTRNTQSTGNRGNGLHGLTERVQALGGTFEAGQRTSDSFHLIISIPLKQNIEAYGMDQPSPAIYEPSTEVNIDTEEKRKEQ